MAKQLQLRRGTTAQHSTFTGAVGEVTIDIDKDVVVVHDGATVGGFPSQKQLVSGTNIKTVNSTTLLGSGDIAVQPTLVSGTNIKTVNSTTLLGSGNIAVQPTLVSGTNIKTVNSTTLLGSGNIAVQPTLVSGTNIKTINNSTILGSGNLDIVSAGIITGGTTNQVLAKNSSTDYDTKWYSVQEPLVSGTNIKTVNSTSLLGSGNIAVQPTLVSGTNIKTINSNSLLGSGNIVVGETAWTANDSRAKTALNASGTAPIYACRAWVNFNGTGTVAIRASGNVSSITDNGVGIYNVNLTTAMPDTNYQVNIASSDDAVAGTVAYISGVWSTNQTTSTMRVLVANSSFGSADRTYVGVAVFR